MFEHVVVAAHFAEAKTPLFKSLEQLRERGTREITLVDVLRYYNRPYSPETDLEETHRKEAAQRLKEEAAELERAGFKVNVELRIGQPAHELCNIARSRHASLILVGTRGESAFREFLRGSMVLQLMRKTRTPVLIEPIDSDSQQITARGLGEVLLATDFSRSAEEAEGLVVELAAQARRVVLLHVVEEDEREQWGEEQATARARDKLEALAQRFPLAPEHVTVRIAQGNAPRQIHRVAEEEGCSLVVLGKRGHSPIPELLLGSTAQMVVKGATQSILLVPASHGGI